MNRLPLEDVTVVDLSWVIAGPHATQILRQMGAHVIKIESHRSMDILRSNDFRCEGQDYLEEGGWHFQMLNTGKENISLNLKTEKGREALEALIRRADFVVCNYGTNAFKKLRLTYEDLAQIKPDIIVLNAAGMGFTGPYSQFVTFAPNLQAVTGISGSVGYEGETLPYDDYPPLADYLGGIAIASHLLAALEYRRKTGKGQFIDLSQFEAVTSYLGAPILDHQVNGTAHALFGNHHHANAAAPHNAYPCREPESWCAIAVADEEEWRRFCGVVDPEGSWTSDPKFFTLERRIENQKELDEYVRAWTMLHTPQEVGELLQAAGVSGVPLQKQRDFLYDDAHVRERHFFQTVDLPVTEERPFTWLICGAAARFPEVPWPESVPAAESIGQDTHKILSEYLGMSEAWIAQGDAEGAFI